MRGQSTGGSSSFPLGVGTQDGPDIPVIGGLYDISFNSNTGAYHFVTASDIGIIGSATPFGWDADVNMFQSDADTNEYYITMHLLAGEAKFRLNDDWIVNWGSADFPYRCWECKTVQIFPFPWQVSMLLILIRLPELMHSNYSALAP